MGICFHPHALERLSERGATKEEVIAAITDGGHFPARFGRSKFQKSFPFHSTWQGRFYTTKGIEAIVVPEGEDWLVITVVTRYY